MDKQEKLLKKLSIILLYSAIISIGINVLAIIYLIYKDIV